MQNIVRLSAAMIAVSLYLAAAAAAQQLTVVQEKAPMFKEPTISSQIIKYLEKNSKVNMLAAEDSFLLVSYGGYEGWVIPYSVTGYEKQIPAMQNTAQPAPAAAQTAEPVVQEDSPQLEMGGYLVVTNDYANVREGPGWSTRKLAGCTRETGWRSLSSGATGTGSSCRITGSLLSFRTWCATPPGR